MPNDVVTATLKISFRALVVEALNAYWLSKAIAANNSMVLLDAITAEDIALRLSTISITGTLPIAARNRSAAGGAMPQQSLTRVIGAGTVLLIGQEPITVNGLPTAAEAGGWTVPVSRGTTQNGPAGASEYPLATPTAHGASTSVLVLYYTSPWEMIRVEALLPYAQGVVAAVGPDLSLFDSSITGTLG